MANHRVDGILAVAIVLGIPVIATEACGLHGWVGVTIVKTGDVEDLKFMVKMLQVDTSN